MRKYILTFLALISLLSSADALTFYGRWMTFPTEYPESSICITTKWNMVDTSVVIYSMHIDKNKLFIDSTISIESTPRCRHHHILGGSPVLHRDSTYYYQIRDMAGTNYSDVDSFKVPSIRSTDFQGIIWFMSDFQIRLSLEDAARHDSSIAVVARLRQRVDAGLIPRPDLIVDCGDMVNTSWSASILDSAWNLYASILDTIHELAPIIPVPGNHDGTGAYCKAWSAAGYVAADDIKAGINAQADSTGWRWHFNTAPSGLARGTEADFGDHQYTLVYGNIRIIVLSVCNAYINHPYAKSMDKPTKDSLQYVWLDSILTATKTDSDIDYILELHHANETPYPNIYPNGAVVNRDNGRWYNWSLHSWTSAEDTLLQIYCQDIRPLLIADSINAMVVTGHNYFSTGMTDSNMREYWGGSPIFTCAGMDGASTGSGSILTWQFSDSTITVWYEKLQTYPTAYAYWAGYPWGSRGDSRFIVFQSIGNRIKGW